MQAHDVGRRPAACRVARRLPRLRATGWARLLLLTCWIAGSWGCRSPVDTRIPLRPLWVTEPKSDDSLHMYRVGVATRQPTAEQAREAAQQHALAEIARAILSSVSVAGAEVRLSASLDIQAAEQVPGGVHVEETPEGFNCWMQMSFPLAEKSRLLAGYERGRPLGQHLERARDAIHRGAFEEARTNLLWIVTEKTDQMLVTFSLDEVKMMLGDVCLQQKDYLDARRWFENIQRMGKDEAVREKARLAAVSLPRPPRFWPMNDRFGGQAVALVCGMREGGPVERSADLVSLLSKECREARLGCLDVSGQLGEAGMARFFDVRDFASAADLAQAGQAGVILGILMDIDPQKRAKLRQSPEEAGIDTQVKFMVVRAGDRTCVFDGSVREAAGTSANSSVAAHALSVLIQNYLIPKCPAVSRDMNK